MPAVRRLPFVEPTWEAAADVVIVGTGAAGLSAALAAHAAGRHVLLVTKGDVGGGSTPLAQGGLAAVRPGQDDTIEQHAIDTIVAGAGLCDPDAVATLVAAAPAEITRLSDLGARWDPGPPGLEGGHSAPRIVHAGGDASGAEVHRVLGAAARAAGIPVLDHAVALDALLDEDGRVGGMLVGLVGAGSVGSVGAGPGRSGPVGSAGSALRVGRLRARAVVLATGGYGQAWATTSNPVGVTGDGLALAARAGAELADIEFVQFHPTVLWQEGGAGRRPLVTEALRGAGATLVDVHGNPVMAGQHPRGDLAPRDVVAAAMQRRMARGDGPSSHLWLDARGVGATRLREEFPTVMAACLAAGVDPVRDLIPVAPGAHYACGGVRADMAGATSLPGLYAVGEVASTGVHGANRLASNSITEALATGHRVGLALADSLPPFVDTFREREREPGSEPCVGVDPSTRRGTAEAMSRHASIVRHAEGLELLIERLAATPRAPAGPLDPATVEATNLHVASTLVAVAALRRAESRGCHRRSDLPGTDEAWSERTRVVVRGGELEFPAAAGAGVAR